MALFGFFCITLGARANPVFTCTVYDAAGLTAISACSDFGKPITYGGISFVRADLRPGSWSFSTGGRLDLFYSYPDYDFQYRAEVALSDHLTGTNYYMIRGGTGLAEVRVYQEGLIADCCMSPDARTFMTYDFPDFPFHYPGPSADYPPSPIFGPPFLYPYNTPFRVTYDVGVDIKQPTPSAFAFSTRASVWLADRNAYIQAVPEPGMAVPITVAMASLLALCFIGRVRR